MRGLFQVPYHDDESIISMWSRLSAANGTDARLFSLDMGTKVYDLAKGEPGAIGIMAKVTGLLPEFLTAHSLVRLEPKNTTLAGHRFPSHRAISRTTTRFCPHCLIEDDARSDRFAQSRRYFRLQWHIRAVRTCPVHNCMIVKGPDISNANLNIDFARYSRNYLDSHRTLRAYIAPLQFSRFESFVCDRLVGRQGHGDFLDSISLSLAIDMVEQAGICLRYGKTFEDEDKLSEAELQVASAEAFRFFERGSAGLEECLDAIANSDTSYNVRSGGAKIYGSLYKRIAGRREPEDSAGCEPFRRHAINKLKLSNRAFVFGPLTDSNYVSLPTWTKEHEVHHSTFRRLLRTLGHEHALVDADGRDPLVDLNVAEEVLAFWRSLVTSAEIERILGVGIDTMRIIQRDDLLSPVLPREKQNRYAKYLLADVTDFLNKVLPAEPNADIEGLFPWRSAVRRAHAVQGAVLRLLLDGRVSRRGMDPNLPRNMYALLLDPKELQRLVASEAAPDVEFSELLSLDQCAEMFRVGRDVVKRLIHRKVLRDVQIQVAGAGSRNFQRGLLPADVTKFRTHYVSMRELRETYDLGRNNLRMLLPQISPGCKVNFPNIKASFFKRPLVEDPAVISELLKRIPKCRDRRRSKTGGTVN